MKSVLEEGSSVPKAIEKAWLSAGQPEEFTIKIFETDQRNFFGFLKKAAVVTILFDPRKTPQGVKDAREQAPRRRERGGQQQRERRGRDGDKRDGNRDRARSAQPAKRASSYAKATEDMDRQQKQQPKEAPKPEQEAAPAKQEVVKKVKEGWTPELIDQMTAELKTVCGMLEISEPSKINARGSTLRIEFEKPVIEDVEYERMLFSSFAHLLFQFVRREHRSKLRGLRIALSSGREQEKQTQPAQ